MVTADDFFDRKLLAEVEDLLRSHSIHRASISIRSLAVDTYPPTTKYERTITWQMPDGGTSVDRFIPANDTLFSVASITKMLVAAAVIHAEVKAEEDVANNKWHKFKGTKKASIKDLYDRYKKDTDPEMMLLPGDPTLFDLIVHSKGLPSTNDRILGPDGTPLLLLVDLLQNLKTLSLNGAKQERWTTYSNMNYAVIALMINTLWDGGLNNFMSETLFEPLGMHSTSIGFPTGRTRGSSRWTVDERGIRRQVLIPEYRADGAEAGALGGYSTAKDLDIFLSSVIMAYHDAENMTGFSKTVATMYGMENNWIEGMFQHTPFGLFTTLDQSTIGLSSTNGLQFPKELFTNYPVIPGDLGKEYEVDYMAGSGVGCCCATALRIHKTDDFALVVLTDTSGPVGVADHVLRLILRRFVDFSNPRNSVKRLLEPKYQSVRTMAAGAKQHTIKDWIEKMEEDQRLKDAAYPEPFDIQGTYEGVGFHQKLHIQKEQDGKNYLAVGGTSTRSSISTPARSSSFQLVWTADQNLWLCVPPHKSIDRLGDADWSNLLFEVVSNGSQVIELRRKKRDKTVDRYTRQT